MRFGNIKNGFLILSWALYDLANQFFALNVVSLYFVLWLTLEKQAPEVLYSIVFGVSTFFIAVLSPILGTISDITGKHRPFLIFLTLLSIIFTAVLGISENIFLGLLFFIIANFGCQTAIVFYNAMMINITTKEKMGLVSGIGRMMGYSGAILALKLIKPKTYQAAFLPTSLLFLFFSLPCMLFIKDKPLKDAPALSCFFKREKIIEIFKSLKAVVFGSHKFPGLWDFLKCSFFGLCAINAIILFMSVYATRVFGLNKVEVTNLITFSTIFAIVGSLFSGFISDYIGYKRCLGAVLILWTICFCFGAFAKSTNLYWLIGAMAGTALGSTWVVSRAICINIVPAEKVGEIFGLFNLVGYLSAIVGAFFWGIMLWLLRPLGAFGYRITLFSSILFILFGFIFLMRIPSIALKDKD